LAKPRTASTPIHGAAPRAARADPIEDDPCGRPDERLISLPVGPPNGASWGGHALHSLNALWSCIP
jgi:hypothetical protein